MNAKYVNASPLNRMEQEFERYGLKIIRQNMANWMIRLGEEYLGVLYGKRFTDKESLITMIQVYIHYYNNKRLQRNLGVLTPP